QPHGALLVVEHERVVAASANLADLTGREPRTAIGGDLATVLGASAAELVARAPEPRRVAGRHGALDVIARRAGPYTAVEVEPAPAGPGDDGAGLTRALRALQGAGRVPELLDRVVVAVRDLTGFDRVMVYRFDAEWNGEVVAEAAAPGLERYLGLRYP